jgi:hypothetical protein
MTTGVIGYVALPENLAVKLILHEEPAEDKPEILNWSLSTSWRLWKTAA